MRSSTCWKCGHVSSEDGHYYTCVKCKEPGWVHFAKLRLQQRETCCTPNACDMVLTFYGHNGRYGHRYYNCKKCGQSYDSDDDED